MVAGIGWVTTKEDYSILCIDNMLTLWRVINAIKQQLQATHKQTTSNLAITNIRDVLKLPFERLANHYHFGSARQSNKSS